jgi:hypothetical protein
MSKGCTTQIAYRDGYRYQLANDYSVDIGLAGFAHDGPYLSLYTGGGLVIRKGYAWDGPSGPTIDTKTFMRGSLVHDALYQLIREGALPAKLREFADRLLRKHCREDGMNWLRAWWVYRALRMFGDAAADPANKKPIIVAPSGTGIAG